MNLSTDELFGSGGIPSLIGKTPLLRLQRLFPEIEVYGKMELLNPAGSVKDRTSKFIIEESLRRGLIDTDTIIVESTSGNMGIGLAQICLYHGLSLHLVVDPYINKQTFRMLQTYGAHVEVVNESDQSGSYLGQRIARVHELLDEYPRAVWTQQYENPLNPLTHHQTASEICNQLGEEPDHVFVATSTCGTLMGFANYFNRPKKNVRVVPVDAYGSVIFGGHPTKRVIPGFGASKASSFIDETLLATPIIIEEPDSIIGCKKLLRHEAILSGGSTGALVAAVQRSAIKPGEKAVMIIFDRGERYVDTIYSDDWIRKTYGEKIFRKINNSVNEGMVETSVC
nr:2,3-diaminopropionate biosynthesis protein SbnA [Cytophagales bacterium]